jgi:hypothetical protein
MFDTENYSIKQVAFLFCYFYPTYFLTHYNFHYIKNCMDFYGIIIIIIIYKVVISAFICFPVNRHIQAH